MGGAAEGYQDFRDCGLGDAADVGAAVVRQDRLDGFGQPGQVRRAVGEQVRQVPGPSFGDVADVGEAAGRQVVSRVDEANAIAGLGRQQAARARRQQLQPGSGWSVAGTIDPVSAQPP